MSINHWNGHDGDRSWDVLILGGKFMPGICSVEVQMAGGLDVKKPKGAKFATIVDEGTPPMILTVKLQLTAQSELDQLKAVLPVLRPRSKTDARAPIAIQHPNANFWGIRNVVVSDIRSPMPTAKEGWTIEIKLIEWVPGPKKLKKPSTTPKDGDEKVDWSAFNVQGPRKDTPTHGPAPMTNLFTGVGKPH